MSENETCVVVAWHREEQKDAFLRAWHVTESFKPNWLILQQDVSGEGCARTKNKGVREAMRRGFDIVVVLDDDCYPATTDRMQGAHSLEALMNDHEASLGARIASSELSQFCAVTDPPSRGTPYNLPTTMPVAASIGFWTGIGDYDACAQLVRGATTPMKFLQAPIFGKYFPLCGMNIAFRPGEWPASNAPVAPSALDTCNCKDCIALRESEVQGEIGTRYWWDFIDVSRFDDIWMGWLWQREAYRRGYCFNLNGPIVRHSRQSNVWQNLRDEAKYLERNETLWHDIATHEKGDYESLRKLLPV